MSLQSSLQKAFGKTQIIAVSLHPECPFLHLQGWMQRFKWKLLFNNVCFLILLPSLSELNAQKLVRLQQSDLGGML